MLIELHYLPGHRRRDIPLEDYLDFDGRVVEVTQFISDLAHGDYPPQLGVQPVGGYLGVIAGPYGPGQYVEPYMQQVVINRESGY